MRRAARLALAAALALLACDDAAREQPNPRAAAPATTPGLEEPARQILFGDLHVHTTFSLDAFWMSLPAVGGEGAHPPADACDFARHCSALDFWSINDHDFSLSPARWRETIDAIRECNARATDPRRPDTVAFLGWEWTQVGLTPETHYGHKNVILAGTADDAIPLRPIAAAEAPDASALGAAVAPCDPNADVRALPADCFESAPTPAVLFRKLREWGASALVIPHGTAWGFYTPPGASWRKQLAGDEHDPALQRLIEVYSGHGDSEAYRDWRDVELAADGSAACPAPRPDYEPTCWRAGEIVRARCAEAGEPAAECEARAAEARRLAAGAGIAGPLVVPGARAEEWLDAGQCRDCREPAFNYRPASSAQAVLAHGGQLGLVASSDNHSARPGVGYKELRRTSFTDSRIPSRPPGGREAPAPPPREVVLAATGPERFETERQASYFLTGGLVGLHAAGRDRDAIWSALERREVYGTTGARILLWFELLDAPGERLPMGGAAKLAGAPRFEARAVGSFEQRPGCPGEALAALGPARLERLCRGECHHPSDRRRRITRIEVVRIRPQQRPDEPLGELIDDPWRVLPCPGDPAGCTVRFEDPDFAGAGRDALYYVRAFEAPAPAINAAGARCERDAAGACIAVNLCGRDPQDDCLAAREPRAWSSPIWVGWGGAQPPR